MILFHGIILRYISPRLRVSCSLYTLQITSTTLIVELQANLNYDNVWQFSRLNKYILSLTGHEDVIHGYKTKARSCSGP